jgi:hypothetical protein
MAGTSNTTTTTTTPGTSAFGASQQSSGGTQLIFSPKTTTITDTQQASQSDIVASLNGVMMSLFGRLATGDEVAKYGAELLAAQKASPTRGTQNLVYANTGKPLTGSNEATSTSVNPDAFFASLLQGNAEASQYRITGTYMDALKQMADSSKGSYNG